MRLTKYILVFWAIVTLAACGSDPVDPIYKKIKTNLTTAESALTTLDSQLKNGTMRNATLLKSYADAARKKKPKFSQVIDVLESEGTKKGPTYKQITQRLSAVKKQASDKPKTVEDATATNLELLNIRAAISNYDAMLVDALNVLSDFTDNELPKLREIEFEDSTAEGGAIGSEYIGNSGYGEWRTGSNGTSFWHWYGQYAFFSTLFRGPVYYDSWSTSRHPSYHHDRANGAYSSPKANRNNTDALNRTKKSYTSKGKTFKSPYAKNTRIKGVSGSTIKGSSQQPFKSSYAKSKSSSSSSKSYKSGYNSRSSNTGRSSFGGK